MNRLTRIRKRIKGNPRLEGILRGGLTGMLGRGLSLLASLVTLPLMVRYLGSAEYGIWITVNSTVLMLAVLDIGISSTLINAISRAAADEDPAKAKGYYATAFWITVGISLLLALIAMVLWHLIDWSALLGLHNANDAQQASKCAIASLLFFLLNLPLSLANKVLSGFQKVQVANYFSMINSVLGLIAILLGISMRLSLSGIAIAYFSAMLTGAIFLNVWVCFVSHPWIRPQPGDVHAGYVAELFGEGILFFVLQIAGILVFNTDNLVISHYCGPASVTPYSVSWRLLSYASMLHGLLIPSLWPALSDAYHRRELDWVRKTYRTFMKYTMTGVVAMAIVLALTGRLIIRVWATQAAVPPTSLLWLMAAWAVMYSFTTNQACLLAATRRIGLQAIMASATALMDIVLSIYLVKRMGPTGAIIGTLASYLVFIIVPQAWEVRNILRGRYMRMVDVAVS
jgi:O-antigen/teichoic acid export membrane protein